MRILLVHRPGGAFGYISDSWMNAFRDKGHTVQRWDANQESWNNFDPDIYIGCSGHKQPIPKSRRAKIAIHVNPFGPTNIHGINESQQNIGWVREQKPDLVFGYAHETDRLLWSYWQDRLGIPWVPLATAGDKVLFNNENADRKLDLIYLGGRWEYKSKTIDPYLLPVLKTGLKYKVHGWGDWQRGVCSGLLPEDQVPSFLRSGKVGPCIAEQHTHNYGIDIPERAFKVALSGTLVVHDAVPSVAKFIPSAVIAKSPADFLNQCKYYCDDANSEERQRLAEDQRLQVLSAHTYHHRMATMLEALNFHSESEDMLRE